MWASGLVGGLEWEIYFVIILLWLWAVDLWADLKL
jgi:hypothetical protein